MLFLMKAVGARRAETPHVTVSLNIFRFSFLRKFKKNICWGEKKVSFCWFMFGLWSVSYSTTHLLYLGCPVRLAAETHWKHQIHAITS